MNYFVGQVLLFAGNYIPVGFRACNGDLLPVNGNEILYSLIGNTYGGDTKMFALPDLRGRLPISFGRGVLDPKNGGGQPLDMHALGEKAGSETVSLKVPEMPAHSHTVYALDVPATSNIPDNNLLADVPSETAYYMTDQKGGATPTRVTMGSQTLSPAGGGAPHYNIMPVVPIVYIICVEGPYPNRP